MGTARSTEAREASKLLTLPDAVLEAVCLALRASDLVFFSRACAECRRVAEAANIMPALLAAEMVRRLSAGEQISDALCAACPDLVLPPGVASVPALAFFGCRSLRSIVLPSSVTSIGANAFSECASLSSVTLPSGLTSIALYAFLGCSSLRTIELPQGTRVAFAAFDSRVPLTVRRQCNPPSASVVTSDPCFHIVQS